MHRFFKPHTCHNGIVSNKSAEVATGSGFQLDGGHGHYASYPPFGENVEQKTVVKGGDISQSLASKLGSLKIKQAHGKKPNNISFSI